MQSYNISTHELVSIYKHNTYLHTVCLPTQSVRRDDYLPPTKCLSYCCVYTMRTTHRVALRRSRFYSSFALYYLCLRFYVSNGGRFSVKWYRIACRSDRECRRIVVASLMNSLLRGVEHPGDSPHSVSETIFVSVLMNANLFALNL